MSSKYNNLKTPIRIGSRGSQLALWQANHILYALRDAGYHVELEIIRTTGDRMQQPGFVPPANLDGKGIFIKEIEEALEEGRIDLAVHSLKDLPTKLAPQFTLAAIPKRADARDVWVCEPYWALHTLPIGGRIGTTSPRRRAQLLALRPDVAFVEVRGNIDTRLKKLAAGQCDALVLAAAGLDRLKRAEWVHQRFSPDEICPAPGQGALALETRSSLPDRRSPRRLHPPGHRLPRPPRHPLLRRSRTHHPRRPRRRLFAPHRRPLRPRSISKWRMFAQVVAPDGESMVQIETEATFDTTAETLGHWVAEDLKSKGALDLLSLATG